MLAFSICIIPITSNSIVVEDTNENSSNWVCIEEYSKIENVDSLIHKSLSEEYSAPEVVYNILENTSLEIDKVTQEADILVATELLASYVDSTDSMNTKQLYATTAISILEERDYQLLAVSNYTKGEGEYSDGGEIYVYVTIYYEVGMQDEIEYISLNGVEARATAQIPVVQVDYVKARYGYSGYNLNTDRFVNRTSSWYERDDVDNTYVYIGPLYGANLEHTSSGVVYNIWGEATAGFTLGNYTSTVTYKVVEAGAGSIFNLNQEHLF